MKYTAPQYPQNANPSLYTKNALKNMGYHGASPDVTSIAMVGALFDLHTQTHDLSRPDDHYAAIAIRLASEHGVRIAHDCTFPIINRKYGHDFLKSGANAPMAVFCHIPYDPNGLLMSQAIDRSTVRQSELANEPGIWHRKSRDSGISWLFNVTGDGYEIPLDFINQPPYELITQKHSFSENRKIDFLRLKPA